MSTSNPDIQDSSPGPPLARVNPVKHASSLAELRQINREASPGDPAAGQLRTVAVTKKMAWLKFDGTDPTSVPTRGEQIFDELRRQGHLRELNKESFVHRMAEHIEQLNTLQPFRNNNEQTLEVHLTRLAAQAGYTLEASSMRSQPWTFAAHLASTTDDLAPLRNVLRKSVTSTRAIAFAEGLKRFDRDSAVRQHPELHHAYRTLDYAQAFLSANGRNTDESVHKNLRTVAKELQGRLNDGEMPQTPSRHLVMRLLREARGRDI